MIIPVKCFTCGKVLADKYRFYEQEVRKIKAGRDMQVNNVIYLTKANTDKTPEGEVLDKLLLDKLCCRRHILTHVNIE
jgi:DNA-directed RNA polymerase subunit N (RpoN/RPB10)